MSLGHYIGEIDKGSPAERAGLKDSDRLVAVNGDEINSCTHEEVVEKIHQQGNKCCLLVLDAETEQMYKLVSLLDFILKNYIIFDLK